MHVKMGKMQVPRVQMMKKLQNNNHNEHNDGRT